MSRRKLLAALVVVPLVVLGVSWAIFYFGFYLGYEIYKTWGHQRFAAVGVSQIQPAGEMEKLFEDCRHYITYDGKGLPLFTSVAYFGGRYELTMRVPVKIKGGSIGQTVGPPEFLLVEVEAVRVTPSGQLGASFSRQLNFDAARWQKVYESGGDFSAIGFNINKKPVPGFQKFATGSRPSN